MLSYYIYIYNLIPLSNLTFVRFSQVAMCSLVFHCHFRTRKFFYLFYWGQIYRLLPFLFFKSYKQVLLQRFLEKYLSGMSKSFFQFGYQRYVTWSGTAGHMLSTSSTFPECCQIVLENRHNSITVNTE